jgi:hypothetical protein
MLHDQLSLIRTVLLVGFSVIVFWSSARAQSTLAINQGLIVETTQTLEIRWERLPSFTKAGAYLKRITPFYTWINLCTVLDTDEMAFLMGTCLQEQMRSLWSIPRPDRFRRKYLDAIARVWERNELDAITFSKAMEGMSTSEITTKDFVSVLQLVGLAALLLILFARSKAIVLNSITRIKTAGKYLFGHLVRMKEHRFSASHIGSKLEERWNALIKYDDEIRAAAEAVRPFGERVVMELGRAYFALNEDRRYLPNIVQRLIADAKQREAENRLSRFLQTANGDLCTTESISILQEAETLGYTIGIEANGTFIASKIGKGESYLRSNEDIQRFRDSIRA